MSSWKLRVKGQTFYKSDFMEVDEASIKPNPKSESPKIFGTPSPEMLAIKGTPQEIRAKASALYQSALRATRLEYYQREMDYVRALRNEADRREAELHY